MGWSSAYSVLAILRQLQTFFFEGDGSEWWKCPRCLGAQGTPAPRKTKNTYRHGYIYILIYIYTFIYMYIYIYICVCIYLMDTDKCIHIRA